MATELIWSSESLDDLDAIAEFIARDSPHHAQRVVETLFELTMPSPHIRWPAVSCRSSMAERCANVSCTAIA